MERGPLKGNPIRNGGGLRKSVGKGKSRVVGRQKENGGGSQLGRKGRGCWGRRCVWGDNWKKRGEGSGGAVQRRRRRGARAADRTGIRFGSEADEGDSRRMPWGGSGDFEGSPGGRARQRGPGSGSGRGRDRSQSARWVIAENARTLTGSGRWRRGARAVRSPRGLWRGRKWASHWACWAVPSVGQGRWPGSVASVGHGGGAPGAAEAPDVSRTRTRARTRKWIWRD